MPAYTSHCCLARQSVTAGSRRQNCQGQAARSICSQKETDKKTIYNLHILAPLRTSSRQVPVANSPQQWVVMNAQALKPSVDASRIRRASSVDLVPCGDVRNTSISPRRDAARVTTAWTCSRYTTREYGELRQPSLSRDTSSWPLIGIPLKTHQYPP